MFSPRRRPPLLPLLATAMALLLALLAFLQYRWLGQVSEGERERLKATLEARARDFARDFDREVTRAAGTFHVPPTPEGDLDPASLAKRWNEWRLNAPYPELIREVLFLQLPARGEPLLRRLDRDQGTFMAADWPAELESWRAERRAASGKPEAGNDRAPMAGGSPRRLMALLQDTPVLLVTMPFVRVFMRGHGSVAEPPEPPLTSFLLLSLDLQQIRGRILPELVSRYFSTEDVFDYRVLIVSTADPANVIFSSDPGPAGSARHGTPADAVVPLFAVRMSEFNALLVPHVGQLAATLTPTAGSVSDERPGKTPPRAGAEPVSAPSAAGGGSAPPQGDRLAVSVIRLRSGNGETTVAIDGAASRWQLRLAHRAGSVDAAVARTRNRNLLVSTTVLLLLAGSFGVMVVATRRAQRLAAQQVEFVAGVTHELRTPLTVIRSAGENLADGVVETPDEVRQYGALITGEGRKLGAMVERVMEYAGMQGSTAPGPREPVDLAVLVDEAVRAVRRFPAAKDADVETEVAEDLPPVLGDGPSLSRAVENLVENALKYGRRNGEPARVMVSVHPGSAGRRKLAVIEVTDHGPGVEPSERVAIFEPFVRGRAAVAARVPGTGLGLSLVRRIVEAHGGTVRLGSPEGPGARFVVTLPAGRSSG